MDAIAGAHEAGVQWKKIGIGGEQMVLKPLEPQIELRVTLDHVGDDVSA